MPSENKTPNYGLNQWQGNEYVKRQDFVDDNLIIDTELKRIENKVDNTEVPVTSVNEKTGDVVLSAADVGAVSETNFSSHLAEYAIQTATGTANAITITTGGDFKYTQGNKIQFKTIENSTDIVTINIDSKGAKPLKKLNGSNTTVKNNKVYEIFYSAGDDCFFLLASAEGDAIAENVLAGKIFSNDDDTGIIGTMTNRGATTGTITTQNGKFTIPAGFHNGAGQITATFANLIASNIKKGVTIGGVAGGLNPVSEKSIYSLGVESVTFVNGVDYIESLESTREKQVDCLYIKTGGNSSDTAYVTDVMVDLTNVNFINIAYTLKGGNINSAMVLNVSKTKAGRWDVYDAQVLLTSQTLTSRISSLDVSSLTGNYYIRVHARTTIAEVKAHAIWFS